jgi:septal ring factor EnvC (AmiA/AmiB activator)
MPAVIPIEFIAIACGAFIAGVLLTLIFSRGGRVGGKNKEADPRDARIRSLEADIRVNITEATKLKTARDEVTQKLAEIEELLQISEAKRKDKDIQIDELQKGLRESVRKTRELRVVLSEKASENIISEVMLREAKTELELAQASTNMMATGELTYDPPDDDEDSR